jgi:hypothetical protein
MPHIEDYSSSAIVSNSTDCTAAINAALADSSNISIPIQLLGKVYLTEGAHLFPSYLKMVGVSGAENDLGSSVLRLMWGYNVDLGQSAHRGDPALVDYGIVLQDILFDGGLGSQTAAAVCPQTYVMSSATPSGSSSTVTVLSTTNFPSSGYIWSGSDSSPTPGQLPQRSAWATLHASAGHALALQTAPGSYIDISSVPGIPRFSTLTSSAAWDARTPP